MPDGPKCGCGRNGCLESLASGTAIARMAKESGLGDMNAKDVCEAAENGDQTAISILSEVGKYLGIGIANIINILDPEAIIIGGSVAKSHKLFMPSMQKALDEKVYLPDKPDILISDMIDECGDLGTIAIVLDGKVESK